MPRSTECHDPTPNFYGATTISVITKDLGSFGLGGNLTKSDSVSINVTAVNDAPVNTVPAAQTTLEDFALVFSTTNGNRISIADVDDFTGNEPMQVTLTATNGVLSLNGVAGLDFTFPTDANGTGAGDGTNDATMTFRGTRSAINTALNGLIFNSLQDYNGPASVAITTNDLGNFGTGAPVPLTASNTVAVTVTPVNDAPTFNLPGNPPTIVVGRALRRCSTMQRA